MTNLSDDDRKLLEEVRDLLKATLPVKKETPPIPRVDEHYYGPYWIDPRYYPYGRYWWNTQVTSGPPTQVWN